LEHRMTALHREKGDASSLNAYPNGRVTGIAATHRGEALNIRARKAVIVATGGSTGNVEFRRMFDPRLTEEYCGLAGMPWSDQDASGELAAMAVGAALWGLANQSAEFGAVITKPGRIGSQWGYVNLAWQPGSKIFDKVRATGLRVADWQDVICVNMLGKRFYDETGRQFTSNNYNSVKPYVHGHWLNAENIRYKPNNWLNAAMQGIGDGKNGGGPIWAIFDSEACAREKWDPNPPYVDYDSGFCFRGDTIEELAAKIKMKYQRVPMPPGVLSATVTNYNTFVEDGVDSDFGKPKPLYKIQKPPFYAAWSTPVIHDTRCGLRIDAGCRVIDLKGAAIPGLYCGGESAGGFSLHGLARCLVQGLISGRNAAGERAELG
jgi:FAD binding domain-containing protein